MGNKINSLRGREEQDISPEGNNVRVRSVSVGGNGGGPANSETRSNVHPSSASSSRSRRHRIPGASTEFGFLWGISSSAPNPGSRLTYPNHHTIWANNVKCPVCSKKLIGDDIEEHLVICLSKPRITYNGLKIFTFRNPTVKKYFRITFTYSVLENVLEADAGECDICFEDMEIGNTIARLPCLCIYHKSCIDQWFDVNRSCPKHPLD